MSRGARVRPGVLRAVARVLPVGWILAVACAPAGGPAPLSDVEPAEAEQAPAEEVVLQPRSWRRVVVDAGHGGEDEGAIGVSGIKEKDVVLAVAQLTARRLRASGFEVVETRVGDETVPLDRRSEVTNASGAGLFVSIHANSAPSASARGVETYSMDLASDEAAARLAERENLAGRLLGEPPVERDGIDDVVADLRMGARASRSRAFAEEVQRALVDTLQELYGGPAIRDRGARTAPFWVLVDSEVPAVLVEIGYLTHEEEEARIRTGGYHARLADAIAAAVARFAARAELAEREAGARESVATIGQEEP